MNNSELTPGAVCSETILVVDDDPHIRSILGEMLERKGYGVLLAENGADGVKTFTHHQQSIDLVLINAGMPDMNGIDVSRIIKAQSQSVPIVLISGYPREALEENYHDLIMFVSFLHKPFSMEELVAIVRQSLGHSEV